jgi:hypothetical protein
MTLKRERIAVYLIVWKEQHLFQEKIAHLFWKKSVNLYNLRIIIAMFLTVST